MSTKVAKRGSQAQTLKHVGDNLYRSDVSGIYYAIYKTNGKQIRRSLHTTDKQLARNRLDDMRRTVGRLSTEDGRRLPFAEYDEAGVLVGGAAKYWIDFAAAGLEASTRDRYLENIRNLAAFFHGKTIGAITLKLAEKWVTSRTPEKCAASTFNKELEVFKRILKYALKHGYRLDNPAEDFERRKPDKGPVLIPSRDEYQRVIAQMRANHADDSADLCEILARSGTRKSEIVGNAKYEKPPMYWRDIDFRRGTFTVTKSKNHESRTVEIFPGLEQFLKDLIARRGGRSNPNDRIIGIGSARTALETACRQLGLPRCHHHTMRHFFCSNAIEDGADYAVIAGWLGHKDGGLLVGRTYGHLRNEHSKKMAKQMTFGVVDRPPDNVIPFPSVSNE